MLARASFRLLLLPIALVAAGCEDNESPFEPLPAEEPVPVVEPASGPLEDLAYWADGYLQATNPTAASYHPLAERSFNRSGGAMTITKVAGTTGRYIARFSGLSALLGGKSTVRVTASGDNNTYCKPVGASLVRDSVEVRCFRIGTGAAANVAFYLQVIGKRDNLAFAFGNQPTAVSYTPSSAGTWNPAGATQVVRIGIGQYYVSFKGLGGRLPANVEGHVQVNAIGTGKTYCKVEEWGKTSEVGVWLRCWTPAGALTDSKFTVLFTPPAAHLAYAWANSPLASLYTPSSPHSSNPVGGAISIRRFSVGQYTVTWTGVDGEIRVYGNVQVTAFGAGNAQCKADGSLQRDGAHVQCFAASGVFTDTEFTVLLGS